MNQPIALKRELNLLEVALSGTGIILGAGVYVLIGDAAALAGNAVWLSFALAALIAVFTGLSYAELSSMFPTAAAEYNYVSHAFHQRLAFIIGIMVILSGIVGAATVSLGFAGYVSSFASLPLLPVAIGLLIGLAVLTVWGIQESTNVAIVLTLIEVGGLVGIIAIGLPHIGSVNYLEMPSGFPGVLAGAALIFFAFQGFEEMVKLSDEAEDPAKTVPRGLILALVITIVLYLLVAIAAVSAVGFVRLATSPAPFAEVASTYLGSGGSTLFTVIALFATANTVLLMLVASSRLTYGMARGGSLPSRFASVLRTRRTPWVATAVVTGVSLLFLLVGNITVIAEITTFTLYVTFFVINAAVIALRVHAPELPRPFRIPLNLMGIPITPVLGALVCIIFIFQLSPSVLLIGAALLAITFGVSYVTLPKKN